MPERKAGWAAGCWCRCRWRRSPWSHRSSPSPCGTCRRSRRGRAPPTTEAAPETSFVGRLVSAYTYTNSGRLATASIDITDNGDASDAFTESYTFDAAGNLTSDGTRTYVYDSNRLAQTKIGTEVQTYFFFDSDKRWRTVQAPTSSESDPNRITYAYTGTGRLSEFKKYSGGSVAVQGTYQYDSVGQRTRSTVTKDGVQTTTDFTYTGLTMHKLEAEEKQGETTLGKWTITYLYDEYGRPYAGIYRDTTDPQNPAAPVTFALVTTDRGDVVALLDANGSPFAAYRYDAWGNPLGAGNVGTGLWAQATTSGETETISLEVATKIAERQVLRYAGYCYDSETGMYYLSARHYDPATRQFLSKDLSRNDGEQSAYQYCGGNPIKNIDPTGYWSWEWAKKIYRGAKKVVRWSNKVYSYMNPMAAYNKYAMKGLSWVAKKALTNTPYVKDGIEAAGEASEYWAGEHNRTGSIKAKLFSMGAALGNKENCGDTAIMIGSLAAGGIAANRAAAKAGDSALRAFYRTEVEDLRNVADDLLISGAGERETAYIVSDMRNALKLQVRAETSPSGMRTVKSYVNEKYGPEHPVGWSVDQLNAQTYTWGEIIDMSCKPSGKAGW